MANRITDLAENPEINLVDIETSDGRWSIGFDLQASMADSMLGVSDPCSETSILVAGKAGQQNGATAVYHIKAFAATVSARRNIRCTTDEELQIVQYLMSNGGLDSALEYVLWNGIGAWDPNVQPSLQNNDVLTASNVSTSVAETLANVINKYSTATVLEDYVVHLGLKAAFDLSAMGYAYNQTPGGQLRIRATDAPCVVSPNYPIAGVALTGPIKIDVSATFSTFQTWSPYDNRTNIRGDALAAIAFDPSTAVRAA